MQSKVKKTNFEMIKLGIAYYTNFWSEEKKIAYKRVCDANSIRRAVDGELFKCKPEQGEKNHFREVSVKAKFACDDVSSECAEVSRGEEGK